MPTKKNERREAAEARNAQWNTLTPKEQLAQLDRRRGKGQGAAKQRRRIQRALEQASEA